MALNASFADVVTFVAAERKASASPKKPPRFRAKRKGLATEGHFIECGRAALTTSFPGTTLNNGKSKSRIYLRRGPEPRTAAERKSLVSGNTIGFYFFWVEWPCRHGQAPVMSVRAVFPHTAIPLITHSRELKLKLKLNIFRPEYTS